MGCYGKLWKASLPSVMAVAAVGAAANALEFALEPIEFLIAQVFEINKAGASAADAAEKFVQFEVKSFGVAVLGVLNNENHQKGDDGRAGVDDELPGIGEVEHRTEHGPDHDGGERQQKGCRRADRQRKPVSADAEAVLKREAVRIFRKRLMRVGSRSFHRGM